VPSPAMHCFMRRGFSRLVNFWACHADESTAYWNNVRISYFDGRARPPIIVVHDGRWVHNPTYFRALMEQPAAFRASVVHASIESNVDDIVRRSLPQEIMPRGWSDGAEAELYRRRVLLSSLGSGQLKLTPAKVAEYIGAPLLCTIPVTTGVLSPRRWVGSAPHRSSRPLLLTFEGTPRQHDAAVARLAAYNQLLAHGARCGGNKNGSCAICSPGAACEPGGGMFKVIANARFCVEPPGDSQLRSHLTIAVLFGCVPVIFDYSHAKYKRSGVSWWPWRMPPAKHSILSTPGAGGLDYSKFAYVVSPVALATGSWVADVLAAATDGRWEMMRAALDEAAPLFAYSRTPCAGGVCDAFSALQDVIRRSRQLRNALLPSLDGK